MPITITVRQNGPYRIAEEDVPNVIIVDHEGKVIPQLKPGKGIALCRCGASVTKPFCDGTHSKIGFIAAQIAQQAVDAEPKA
jgi:CDGSH-type Zn-finger protein